MSDNQTSAAWALLDARFQIRERVANGEVVDISADEIKETSGREPRLMTKFDTRESRPTLLAKSTILPVSNGAYRIVPGDGYESVATGCLTRRWPLSGQARMIHSLPWSDGPASESQALDMAMASGILHDFVGESHLHLTIRGRRRAPKFDFGFKSAARVETIAVDGVQIEVDSGLEGAEIYLIEGKLGTRDNFHVRQLYYPTRMWQMLLPQKQSNALFLSWSNRTFSVRRYAFEPLQDYHGLRLTAATDYVLDDESESPSLGEILATTTAASLPADVPFPQADDLRKVVDAVDGVSSGHVTREMIAAVYDFDERQADYYANGAAFLGLLRRRDGEFSLTPDGSDFVRASRSSRASRLARRLASMPVFRATLEAIHRSGTSPPPETVEEWLRGATVLADATVARRSKTVVTWCRKVAVMLCQNSS